MPKTAVKPQEKIPSVAEATKMVADAERKRDAAKQALIDASAAEFAAKRALNKARRVLRDANRVEIEKVKN